MMLMFDFGLQLGAVWEEHTTNIQLCGNFASSEARGLVLSAIIDDFAPVLLAFAWTKSKDAPLILGHMNFFNEFNVCFYRFDLAFELCPRQK